MKEHWPRWFFASCSKHFKDRAGSFPLYIEGTDRPVNETELKDFAEFRMDGPRVRQLSRSVYRVDVVVNILLQSVMDQRDSHRIYKLEGTFLEAFTPNISIFKYGDGDDDSQELLTCIGTRTNFDIRVAQFGIIDVTNRRLQASIECPYRGLITL